MEENTIPEQPAHQEEKSLEEKVELPKPIAKALGKGLHQLFSTDLEEIDHILLSIQDPNAQFFTGLMQKGRDEFSAIIKGLQYSDRVTLTRSQDEKGGNWLFKFSGTDAPAVEIGEIIVNKDTFPEVDSLYPFIATLYHNLGTPLSVIYGFSELFSHQASIEVQNAGTRIQSYAKSMLNKLSPLQDFTELRLNTTEEGTTLTPIHNPTP